MLRGSFACVGETVPNAVVAKLSAAGDVCIRSHAVTHVIVDVNAYVPGGSSAGVVTVDPVRLTDTREAGTPVAAGGVLRVPVAGRGLVPGDASAVVLNVTAVGPAGAGHLTVFACTASVPNASSVNYVAGQTVANAVVAKLSGFKTASLLEYAAFERIPRYFMTTVFVPWPPLTVTGIFVVPNPDGIVAFSTLVICIVDCNVTTDRLFETSDLPAPLTARTLYS